MKESSPATSSVNRLAATPASRPLEVESPANEHTSPSNSPPPFTPPSSPRLGGSLPPTPLSHSLREASVSPSRAPSPALSTPAPHAFDQGSQVDELAGKKRKEPSITVDEAVGPGREDSIVPKKRRKGPLLTEGDVVGKKRSRPMKEVSRGRKPVHTTNDANSAIRPRRQAASSQSDSLPAQSSLSTSALVSSSITTPAATSSPTWFSSALTMLRSEELGPTWLHLVSLWEVFERKHDFKPADGRPKLSSTCQPSCIGEWMKNARRPSWRPVVNEKISFNSQFEADFSAWWAILLPEKSTASCIAKPGVNGLLSIVAALFFWGSSGGQSSAWAKSLKNVVEALTELVA